MRAPTGLLLFVLLVVTLSVSAQENKLDSLKREFHRDPTNVVTHSKILEIIRKSNPDSTLPFAISVVNYGAKMRDSTIVALGYSYRGLAASDVGDVTTAAREYRIGLGFLKSRKDSIGIAYTRNLLRNLGLALSSQGKFKEAERVLDSALTLAKEIKDTAAIINTVVIYGQVCKEQSKYNKALEMLYSGLTLAEKSHDEPGKARLYNNIANVYVAEDKFSDALIFYKRSLAIKKRVGSKLEIANTYGNMGVCYYSLKNTDQALRYYDSSLTLKREVKDKRGIATTLHNIGLIFTERAQYDSAEVKISEALALRTAVNDLAGIASSQNALGQIYIETGRCNEAIPILQAAAYSSEQLGAAETHEKTILHLAEAYACNKDFQKAYTYMQQYQTEHDSVVRESNRKLSEEMKSKFESDQQDEEIQQLKKEKVLGDIQRILQQDRDRQRNYFWIAAAAACLMIVGFLVVRVRDNRKSNIKLQAAYTQIEVKNKDITDSIVYAKRIQESILPDQKHFDELFPDSFIYYVPKDIVSGDFWWMRKMPDGSIAIAVADCTGHGVPGAFMSVMCSELLSQAVELIPSARPDQLLDFTDKGIQRQLKQGSELSGSKEGMDIALLLFSSDRKRVWYSGANRPVLRSNGENIEVLKPLKTSLGGPGEKSFEVVEIVIKENDMLFLFSDGYADQFGGLDGKKYKTSALTKLLHQNATASGITQRENIAATFDNWRGSLEQVDDVCVIGIRC